MKARDIMTPNPSVVTPDEHVVRAAEIMRDLDVGIVPVVADRSELKLVGLITDRDIAVRLVAEGRGPDAAARDCMTVTPITTVAPDADASEVIGLMERERVRRIPVVDAGQRVVGIIAQADLAVKLGPREPKAIEHLLERISEPAHAVR